YAKLRPSAVRNASTGEPYELVGGEVAGTGLVDVGPRSPRQGQAHLWLEVEHLVENGREDAAHSGAGVVDPGVALPDVVDELRSECAGRVHRRAGQRAAAEDVHRQHEADPQAGDSREG